jgi:hypothetical protein
MGRISQFWIKEGSKQAKRHAPLPTLEIEMKRFLVLASLAFCGQAYAGCVGTGIYKSCTDDSGNTYNVSKYGNTTHTTGSNAQTGSTWSQNSTTFGNTTHHNGTAANGRTWSGTTATYGKTDDNPRSGITIHSGVDSDGNVYSKTCTAYGCN